MSTPVTFTLDLDCDAHRTALFYLLSGFVDPASVSPTKLDVEHAEPEPEVQVAEPEPEVQVAQPEPEVQVAQPEPEPEPEVQAAEPEPAQLLVPEPKSEVERDFSEEPEPAEVEKPEPQPEAEPEPREVTVEDFETQVRQTYAEDKSVSTWLRAELDAFGVKKINQLSDDQRFALYGKLVEKYDPVPF